jgi:hypothetical protein
MRKLKGHDIDRTRLAGTSAHEFVVSLILQFLRVFHGGHDLFQKISIGLRLRDMLFQAFERLLQALRP